MKYHAGEHESGILLWKGDVGHDYGQCEINDGEWMFWLNTDHGDGKISFDDNRQELEFFVFELPKDENGSFPDSDDVVKDFATFDQALGHLLKLLAKYGQDNYDLVKGVFK